MTLSQPINIPNTPTKRKQYAPFSGLMRSTEFQGKGACLAENIVIDQGWLQKIKGLNIFTDTELDSIVWTKEFKKSDDTIQTLIAYTVGSTYKIRALEEDLTADLTVPTGGAGDVAFTSRLFDMIQIGTHSYIVNYSTSTPMYSWNGAALTAITNAPTLGTYIEQDGNRVGVNKKFSGAISGAMTDFTAGTGVAQGGDYAVDIEPVGGVQAGAGIIIFGTTGANAVKVLPNASSDDVSAKNKIDTFTYTGLGITNTHQVIAGKRFVYFINSEGIHEMNPFNGNTSNLCDQGNIKRRWELIDTSNAFLTYDRTTDRVLVQIQQLGQLDTMVIVDLKQSDRAISFQPKSYLGAMAMVGTKLLGTDSNSGVLFEINKKYADSEGAPLKFRFNMEWDGVSSPLIEDKIKQFSFFTNLHPQSSFTAKLYLDGSKEVFREDTFTTTAALETGVIGSAIGTYGKYVLNLGGARAGATKSQSTDNISNLRKNAKISTFCLEITEESYFPFTVYDIIMEYKTKGKIIKQQIMPQTLF